VLAVFMTSYTLYELDSVTILSGLGGVVMSQLRCLAWGWRCGSCKHEALGADDCKAVA
jgi:hypothetical protein